MVRRQGALNAVTVNEVYAADLPMVEMDVPRIKQVFLNIINNAVYAMKDGGCLDDPHRRRRREVRVAFEDTGPGIPADILGRIFDPFFTTKPEVSGTGPRPLGEPGHRAEPRREPSTCRATLGKGLDVHGHPPHRPRPPTDSLERGVPAPDLAGRCIPSVRAGDLGGAQQRGLGVEHDVHGDRLHQP